MQVLNKYIGEIVDSQNPKYICLNTNLFLDKDNKNYLFGTMYQILKQYRNDLNDLTTNLLLSNKYGVQFICSIDSNLILSFPTRIHWKRSTNIGLFRRSCAEINYKIKQKKFIEELPIYIPILLQNVNFMITHQDLVAHAQQFLGQFDNVYLVPTVGTLRGY